MKKPAEQTKPPDHRAYPRGKAAAPPKPTESERRFATWSRAVPPDRSFPRT
jgi:hypothetical protein